MIRVRNVGNALLSLGVLCLAVAAIAFTTQLPEPFRQIGEYCFYGWWVPFLVGYFLRRLSGTAGR